jgi:hypothetical protein
MNLQWLRFKVHAFGANGKEPLNVSMMVFQQVVITVPASQNFVNEIAIRLRSHLASQKLQIII